MEVEIAAAIISLAGSGLLAVGGSVYRSYKRRSAHTVRNLRSARSHLLFEIQSGALISFPTVDSARAELFQDVARLALLHPVQEPVRSLVSDCTADCDTQSRDPFVCRIRLLVENVVAKQGAAVTMFPSELHAEVEAAQALTAPALRHCAQVAADTNLPPSAAVLLIVNVLYTAAQSSFDYLSTVAPCMNGILNHLSWKGTPLMPLYTGNVDTLISYVERDGAGLFNELSISVYLVDADNTLLAVSHREAHGASPCTGEHILHSVSGECAANVARHLGSGGHEGYDMKAIDYYAQVLVQGKDSRRLTLHYFRLPSRGGSKALCTVAGAVLSFLGKRRLEVSLLSCSPNALTQNPLGQHTPIDVRTSYTHCSSGSVKAQPVSEHLHDLTGLSVYNTCHAGKACYFGMSLDDKLIDIYIAQGDPHKGTRRTVECYGCGDFLIAVTFSQTVPSSPVQRNNRIPSFLYRRR